MGTRWYIEVFRSESAVNRFIERMLEEVEYCQAVKKKHFKKDIVMTTANRDDFKNAFKCHICDKEYTV